MTRLVPLLAAFGALALTATACSSGEDPGPNYSSVSTTPTSSNPTPSGSTIAPNTSANVSPGSVKPTLPASAARHSSDGGLAFASYYWRMLDWAYATNDSSVLDGLASPTCKSCEAFQRSIATDVGAGYTLLGGRIAIKNVQTASLTGGTVTAELAFDVALTVEALQEKAADGSVATSYPASTSTQRTYLSWTGQAWRVVNTAQVAA